MPTPNLELPNGLNLDSEVHRLLNERLRQLEEILSAPRLPLVVTMPFFPGSVDTLWPATVILEQAVTFRTARATLKVAPVGGTIGVRVRLGGMPIVGMILAEGSYDSGVQRGAWTVPVGVPLSFEVVHGGTPVNAASLAVMMGF